MSKMHEHKDDAIDTKEEIELEKEKWSLTKYKADTIIAIVRDAALLLVMVTSTVINFIAGKAAKVEFSTLESVARSEGEGYGSGPSLDVIASSLNAAESTQSLDSILNIHTGLGSITIAALVFFILPRVKNFLGKGKK